MNSFNFEKSELRSISLSSVNFQSSFEIPQVPHAVFPSVLISNGWRFGSSLLLSRIESPGDWKKLCPLPSDQILRTKCRAWPLLLSPPRFYGLSLPVPLKLRCSSFFPPRRSPPRFSVAPQPISPHHLRERHADDSL